jgi:spore cortex formation protein SpoVR/YcgB (stage V sporulation)
MDALETELRALLLKKNDPQSLAKLYLLLDSVRTLADTIEAELDTEDDSSSSSDEEEEEVVEESDSDDSDVSFTKEERKLIKDPEHRAFLKRYSIVPTERYSIVPKDKI